MMKTKKRVKATMASQKTISTPRGKFLILHGLCTRNVKRSQMTPSLSSPKPSSYWVMSRWRQVSRLLFYRYSMPYSCAEKFDQAITDYSAGLDLKIELLPQSSRQIAEIHYKLCIVLDMSSGRLSEAIEHAEKALASVEARLAELRNAASGQMKVESISPKPESTGKGKAAARGPRLLGDDAVQYLDSSKIAAQIKEMEGLKEDLALKVFNSPSFCRGESHSN